MNGNDVDGNEKIMKQYQDYTFLSFASSEKCLVSMKFKEKFFNEQIKMVHESNEIRFLGNVLALFHITFCMTMEIPLTTIDIDFYYLCLCLVTTSTKAIQSKATECNLMMSYKVLFDLDQYRPIVYYNGHSQFNRHIAMQMADTTDDYNADVMYSHMVSYVRAKYRVIKLKQHAKFIVQCYTSETPLDYSEFPEDLQIGEESIREIITTEAKLWQSYSMDDRRFAYRFMMLQTIETMSTDEYSFPTFTLIPVCSHCVYHIAFDMFGIKHLWDRLKPSGNSKTKEFNDWQREFQERETIDKWFEFPKVESNFIPGKIVTTNGYTYDFSYINRENSSKGVDCESHNREKLAEIASKDALDVKSLRSLMIGRKQTLTRSVQPVLNKLAGGTFKTSNCESLRSYIQLYYEHYRHLYETFADPEYLNLEAQYKFARQSNKMTGYY